MKNLLSPEQIEQFQTDGFLLGPRVLDDAQIEVLRAETLRVIEDKDHLPAEKRPVGLSNMGDEQNTIWQIVNIWQASEPFRALFENPRIVQPIAQLTDARELRLFHDQIQYKPAQKGGVNMWHQDSPYWPILQPKTTEFTAWVALDDVDEENGCMWMVPGSHHWGDAIEFLHTLKKFEEMPANWNGHDLKTVACPVKAGHVHFHHALTWHGSNANHTGRPRRAIALHYMNQNTVYDANGKHLMKQFVTVGDGEKMTDEKFPLVYTA